MGVHQSGARITMRDVNDLNLASEQLAAAADMIKRANPVWAPATVQLLIEANTTIVRIQHKGARAFARYLEKHGVQEAPGAAEAERTEDDPDLERKTQAEEA